MQLTIEVEFSFHRRPSKDEIVVIERGVKNVIEQIPDMVVTNLNIKFL